MRSVMLSDGQLTDAMLAAATDCSATVALPPSLTGQLLLLLLLSATSRAYTITCSGSVASMSSGGSFVTPKIANRCYYAAGHS